MADMTTTQVIANGPRNLIIKLTDVSDGTGLSGFKVVDAQSAAYAAGGQVPGVHLKVRRIVYDVHGMVVRLQWEAKAPVDLATLSGFGHLDFRRCQGLSNPGVTAAPGATGSILLTTIGAAAGGAFTIHLEMIKGVPQF
ncbi:conserved hypothetical protein [Gluconacetobacter diazotrophicus PA1 5]|uniref:Uncharacterized protein n=3 Tax=Gluconacetobacter diazotrophicus TaxID=33996 RepID=A9H7B9_GLUDA|nr:conserved hypothetical protein [Gluconacetobacter diazotrophicus PA1 5]MBB2156855.1 hypothetical protein [Gluconacetobacter diazotrophicus]TWB04801.1 hypothetical protein FBZ86_11923 [Gluconacetobacter diazotrophicus]CAP57618.1 hypothetical protein GDI3675 [Gluconacetobacter diazotrophicus PA1 5]